MIGKHRNIGQQKLMKHEYKPIPPGEQLWFQCTTINTSYNIKLGNNTILILNVTKQVSDYTSIILVFALFLFLQSYMAFKINLLQRIRRKTRTI